MPCVYLPGPAPAVTVANSILCVFMMWGANLPFTIRIMKAPSSLLSAFLKKFTGLCIMNVEC